MLFETNRNVSMNLPIKIKTWKVSHSYTVVDKFLFPNFNVSKTITKVNCMCKYCFYHIVGNTRVILNDHVVVYILKLSVQLIPNAFLNCSFIFLKWKPERQSCSLSTFKNQSKRFKVLNESQELMAFRIWHIPCIHVNIRTKAKKPSRLKTWDWSRF